MNNDVSSLKLTQNLYDKNLTYTEAVRKDLLAGKLTRQVKRAIARKTRTERLLGKPFGINMEQSMAWYSQKAQDHGVAL